MITRLQVTEPGLLHVSDDIRVGDDYGRVIAIDGDKVTVLWYDYQWWHRLVGWLKGLRGQGRLGGRVVRFGVD